MTTPLTTAHWCDCGEKILYAVGNSIYQDGITHTADSCAKDYFVMSDGYDLTLWRRNLARPDLPEAVVRQCDVSRDAWLLLTTHPDVEQPS